MHIYEKFLPIELSDYNLIYEEIQNQRHSKIYSDLLSCSKYTFTLEELYKLSDIPNNLCITISKFKFDMLFNYINKTKLYIILSGAKNSNDKLPIFRRWSWNSAFDGSVLYIADPMLTYYKDLLLGWYYGNEEENIYTYIYNIVKAFRDKFKFKNIIFYGSSGGGFAALQACCYFKDAFSIAINPQTNILNYTYAQKFVNITGINLYNDKFNRNDIANIIKTSTSNFLIIQNDTDIHHFTHHLLPLLKKYNMNPQYGIQKKENLFVWIYHALGGHLAQEDMDMLQIILYLVDKILHNKELSTEEKNIAIAISEIWAKIFYFRRQLENAHK